jgi:acetyl-CoA carboxylase biotin carboxyl carrier protein
MNETGAAAMEPAERDDAHDSQQNQLEGENRERGGGGNRRGGHRRNRRHSQQPPQQHRSSHQPDASLNMTELRELADLVSQHGFTDFEFENENIRVRLRKELAPQIYQSAPSQPVSFAQPQQQNFAPAALTNQSAPPATTAASVTEAEQTPATEDEDLFKITSPIVGTFYRSPSPEAEPFVKIGSQVSADSIVCIVEAMKLMNEIPAETAGEIVKIYVENGQPVEYGQSLFGVKK